MQMAQSKKQVRIRKPRALEQDRFNTKGDEMLPDAPSYWKECVLHTCLGPSAPGSWWVMLPLPKLEEAASRACLISWWNCWIQKSGGQSPGLPIFSASLSNSFSRHTSKKQPWYSPGKKGNMVHLHMVERKSSRLQRTVLKSSNGRAPTDEQSWFAGGKGADEHFILHPSIISLPCLFLYSINHTTLPSGEGFSSSQDGFGHKQCLQNPQKVVPAELKSKPIFPRLFLGQQHLNCVVSSCAFVLK